MVKRMNKAEKAAKKYIDQYPEDYDALKDQLAEQWDYATALNELLKHLREVLHSRGVK